MLFLDQSAPLKITILLGTKHCCGPYETLFLNHSPLRDIERSNGRSPAVLAVGQHLCSGSPGHESPLEREIVHTAAVDQFCVRNRVINRVIGTKTEITESLKKFP